MPDGPDGPDDVADRRCLWVRPVSWDGAEPGTRGTDARTESLFGYVGGEARVPAGHPLRPIRAVVDKAAQAQSGALERLFAPLDRPSSAPGRVVPGWVLLAV